MLWPPPPPGLLGMSYLPTTNEWPDPIEAELAEANNKSTADAVGRHRRKDSDEKAKTAKTPKVSG